VAGYGFASYGFRRFCKELYRVDVVVTLVLAAIPRVALTRWARHVGPVRPLHRK